MISKEIRLKIRDFDFVITLVILLLCALSIVIIFSTTFAKEIFGMSKTAFSQFSFVLIGLALFTLFSFLDYRLFKNITWILYFVVIGLLVYVLIQGKIVHGASRWIPLGFFDLQPSELAKLVLILFLGFYFQDKAKEGHPALHILISFIFTAILVALVAIQPDLGTALVFLVIWFGMLVASNIKKIYVALLPVLGILILPLAWNFLRDYQKLRILNFLNPTLDPLGSGYHQLQAIIAVGSGGFFGRGLGHGPQSQLQYLPASHTDFIFAAIAEELGFIGAFLVLVLFLILLWRVLRTARLSQDEFGTLIASGVFIMVLFQVLVNVGMNLGVMPITGIPLPLVSYGGSSLITTLIALGILESISLRHRKIAF